MEDAPEQAKLIRRDRASWVFTWDNTYQAFTHTTNKGTLYVIMESLGRSYSKPFWIARVINRKACTCEHELRAESIEFEGGGKYVFPV